MLIYDATNQLQILGGRSRHNPINIGGFALRNDLGLKIIKFNFYHFILQKANLNTHCMSFLAELF